MEAVFHYNPSAQVGILSSTIPTDNQKKKKGGIMPKHPSHLRFINPSGLSTAPGFTRIVEVTGGRTIYLSGQVAVDRAFHLVSKGDFRAQAEQIFENLKREAEQSINLVGKHLLCYPVSTERFKRPTTLSSRPNAGWRILRNWTTSHWRQPKSSCGTTPRSCWPTRPSAR
jgi:enamine deaminase RidA (YjgF/YER057c/UK114 family)